MSHKWVYAFGEGDRSLKALLGGKGANLAEMSRLGLPVPPGFTISTEACREFLSRGGQWPEGLWDQVQEAIRGLEGERHFGDAARPLLVSVRSGAALSMPGMMDTILNLGLNPAAVQGLAQLTSNPRFAADARRRLIQIFARVVMGVGGEPDPFEEVLDDVKRQRGAASDAELDLSALEEVEQRYLAVVESRTGRSFPEDPQEQLKLAIEAVFRSWNGDRARTYRRLNRIPDDLGTAVNVQTMVFGNMGDDSGTGVAFTRNPSTGEPGLYGEWLPNAQGEDVVAGVRTPLSIQELADKFPALYQQFLDHAEVLEKHYHEMQDMEFTVERGSLYMLQTRTGKRTGAAAVKIAVDLVKEKLISEREAVRRVDPAALDQLLHPMIDPAARVEILATGLAASPGAAKGQVALDPDEAVERAARGEKVILVRVETTPEDIHGMAAAQGVLTARGGMTSHAAVVARGMGKPCVAGAAAVSVDLAKGVVTVGERTLTREDWLTLDGTQGRVLAGQVPTVDSMLGDDYQTLMVWADKVRKAGVRTNADTPAQARKAVELGAEGIGLCRTEHMFFETDRILPMRRMILAKTREERREALAALEPLQQADFEGLFEAMAGRPVTIRTLDPPLHEFLPHEAEEIEAVAKTLGVTTEELQKRIRGLSESNPMLGFRGCRLGLLYPEITEMQARAIINAAVAVKKRGVEVHPEIMIPLVCEKAELELQGNLVRKVAAEVMEKEGVTVDYLVGTMIELPRAALMADEIAEVAEFFSFGTNDLTQTACGLSRDDSGSFLPHYVENRWFPADPFQVLDTRGVGKLVVMGTTLGRQTRPDLKVGICGEHGGEPESVKFCVKTGLDYVSCSPYRVPIARLAAAQAALEIEEGEGERRDV